MRCVEKKMYYLFNIDKSKRWRDTWKKISVNIVLDEKHKHIIFIYDHFINSISLHAAIACEF